MRLIKRFIIVIRYFFFDGSFNSNVKKHLQLNHDLHLFVAGKLISAKTPLIYLRKYISMALPLSKKAEILGHHYNFLKNTFSPFLLRHLFTRGIVCYAESKYQIILSGSNKHEREGSLSLYFKADDVTMAILSFTISSGKIFNVENENIAVVSRFQQINAHLEEIKEAKKYFQDIVPATVLFTVFEAICVVLNIRSVLGIYGRDQLSYNTKYHRSYLANYDEYWMHNGGIAGKYGYMMTCPFPQKDLLEIKQTHRNRAKRKRARLAAIYDYCQGEFTQRVPTEEATLVNVD